MANSQGISLVEISRRLHYSSVPKVSGNRWLRVNDLAVNDEAEDLLESAILSVSTEQAAANRTMEKLCFDAVYKMLCRCREDPSLIPSFHCICLMNEDGNSIELRCCVSFEQ